MSTDLVVDYTQFYTWQECPWRWVEKYARGLVPIRVECQRDDAMALGSLVHGGLEEVYRSGVVNIPDSVIVEVNPTLELVQEAAELVRAYADTFSGDTWETQELEKTLTWPIREGIRGAAKLDRCMKLERDTVLATGLGGMETMAAGWWAQEYKTKSPMKQHQRAAYIKQWGVNMQAAFQLLGLREYVRGLGGDSDMVQGVLVTVIERAGEYVPKRKCKNKGCGQTVEMGMYLMLGGGEFACPLCGWAQELSPVKETMKKRMPVMYRVVATRTAQQLAGMEYEIMQVAQEMAGIKMQYAGQYEYMAGVAPRRAACVDPWWGRTCEYFEAHAGYVDVADTPGYEVRDTKRYMGLEA